MAIILVNTLLEKPKLSISLPHQKLFRFPQNDGRHVYDVFILGMVCPQD